MHNKELLNKISYLENYIDLLETEILYLNDLLVKCGFPQGILTLKRTIEDLLPPSPSL